MSLNLPPAEKLWSVLSVPPHIRTDERAARRYRAFALGHLGAAFGAGMCWLVYAVMNGPLGNLEMIAGIWLFSPALVALVPRLTGSLGAGSAVSIVNLTALISYLSLITGGPNSFLLVWLVIVPLEAALSGSRKHVMAAILLCALALSVMIGLDIAGLPRFEIVEPTAAALRSAVIFLALAYVGAAALALRRTQAAMAAAAQEGEARYRLLADHALDMISRHGPDGRLCFVSPACAAILGFTPAELEGQAAASHIHPEDRRRFRTAVARGIYLGESTALEYRHLRKNGGYVWLESRCRPVPIDWSAESAAEPLCAPRNAGPHVAAYDLITVTRDISDRKLQEAKLREARDAAEAANQAKTRFLAGMSHELRTPLNAILGFSEVMKSQMYGALGHARYLDYARHIHESGQHLCELIDDVLDLAKIEAGKYRLNPEPLNLRSVLESVVRTMSVTARQAGIVLELVIQPGLPPLRADRRATKQMLLNLVSNAVKFTPRGGRVTVSAGLSAGAVVLEVRDTGLGIEDEELRQLAQPFQQAVSVQCARKARQSEFAPAPAGTGLGLATVKSLAKLHGGELHIQSVPGKGTCVRITLPADTPMDAAMAAAGAVECTEAGEAAGCRSRDEDAA